MELRSFIIIYIYIFLEWVVYVFFWVLHFSVNNKQHVFFFHSFSMALRYN